MVNTVLDKVAILGAGIAGISAAYHLRQKGISSVIYEKDADWGGLCGNFTINGFRFDRFVHLSFATEDDDKHLFGYDSMIEHIPFPSNYYHGKWIRHPAQNNLAPLSTEEKVEIISDFINRPKKQVIEIKNYGEWLETQYGRYFAEHFPFVYTKKYWGLNASQLETKWVGVRMYVPDLKEVLKGAFETQEQCFYFAKKMYYPAKGGFRSILNQCRDGLDIKLNSKVYKILPKKQQIVLENGQTIGYSRIISSIPLPEIVKILSGVKIPEKVTVAVHDLHWTCGYQISLGFNRSDIAKHLWFYIYDPDIYAARVYSPSLKSPDNAPTGCSSLQAEVFFDCKDEVLSPDSVLENTISKFIEIGLFNYEDLIVKDIRYEPYANVTFIPSIYQNRKIILDFLSSLGIESIGRFGKWDYKWTHQAFADGKELS